jgi:uncharacterized protein
VCRSLIADNNLGKNVTATPLTDRLQQEMNASRKAQNKARTLLLGTLISAVRNREIELGHAPTDPEVVEVLRRGIKTRRESVEQYQKGGRTDLADQETAEIAILQEFLPADVDPALIRQAVKDAIASGATDVGKVMAQVMPKFKGQADGKVINQIVREELQAG